MRSLLRSMNRMLSEGYYRLFLQRPHLIGLTFHKLFPTENEITPEVGLPNERLTREALRTIVDEFHKHGYTFVKTQDIGRLGEEGVEKAVAVTFDDGYFNNYAAFELLHEKGVPFTIFPLPYQIRTGKAFWWDVVHRERKRQGMPNTGIKKEMNELKERSLQGVEAHIEKAFGPEKLYPVGDLDRPLRTEEFEELARSDRVEIGNHSYDHPSFASRPFEEVRDSVQRATNFFTSYDIHPVSFAYPFGDRGKGDEKMLREEGVMHAWTMEGGQNLIPVEAPLSLKRFQLQAGKELSGQLYQCRVGVSLLRAKIRSPY